MLSDPLRRRLVQIADAMIPGTDEMPAASEVGVASSQLAPVLEARPDLIDPLQRALGLVHPDEPLTALDSLRTSDHEAHEALVLIVLGGYYLSERVTEILGYPGQQPEAVRPDTYPPYVAEGLLDQVLERGPLYRSISDE